MKLNMFRTTNGPSSRALNYTWQPLVFHTRKIVGRKVGGCCQAQYVPAEAQYVPAEAQYVPAEAQYVPAVVCGESKERNCQIYLYELLQLKSL
jgi:hypothetical protein